MSCPTPGNNINKDATQHPAATYKMAATTTRLIYDDPMHDLEDVLFQIDGPDGLGPNGGYVTNYAATYPTTTQLQEIMNYYDVGDNSPVPNLHKLAREYTICDRWFSSLPGPTFANRVFMHTGTSRGYTTNSPGNRWTQMSIYDLLGDNSIPWAIYCSDLSSTVLLQPMPVRVYTMSQFWDALNGSPADLPKYCFLEPNYGAYSNTSENDQHPMSDVTAGDRFIRDVYNKLRQSAAWESSLLIIIYDEHGGFYDHVPQPPAVPPDDHRDGSGFNFDRLGVRVPAVLVSPWLDKRVISDTFDHTSALKFVIDQFDLTTTLLGDRVAVANTFGKYLLDAPRKTYGCLPEPNLPPIDVPNHLPNSDLQRALIAAGPRLAEQISDVNVRRSLTASMDISPQQARGLLAIEQYKAFLTDRAKQRTPAAAKPRKAKTKTKTKTRTAKVKARKTKAPSTKPRQKRRAKK